MLVRATLALALTLALAPAPASATTSAPVPLDGSTAHHALDGIGALSAGASSRLLFDYPAAQRADILDLLFKPSFGASLHMLKVEIGGDAQSTDGSEPSHMHTRDDLSCARGYESWLIAEAKQRNPLIKTYALQWAAPAWVGDGAGNGTGFYSADNHAYLVKWLECVRNTTGATVDYLGTWNEKPPAPPSYVKDLRTALDAAGFGATRISIFDNDYSLNNLVAQAVADADFNASFVSVGRHYPCDYPGPAIESVLHKAYWASEDSSAANDWAGASCWARLLNQNYVRMNISATIAWSLIWSASAGLPFSGNGLMSAQQPWSGHYSGGDGAGNATDPASLNGPLWATAHTTQFTAPGWRYLSVPGGGSGFLPADAGNGSFVTLVPPGDLSALTIVIEKAVGPCKCAGVPGAGEPADGTARFALGGGLPGAGTVLHVWRTNASAQFVRDADVVVGADGTVAVFVARDSIVTLSTVATAARGAPAAPIPRVAAFPLPHFDDFSAYAEDATPARFFSDEQGSFAVRAGALAQVVTLDPGRNRWVREDVDPLTLIGDAALADVTVSVGATFAAAPNASGAGAGAFGFTYAQACARVTAYSGLRNGAPTGFCLAVNATGAWALRAGAAALGGGQLPAPFDASAPHALVLALRGPAVTAWVLDGAPPAGGGAPAAPPLAAVQSDAYAAGLVALGSGYHAAAFTDFSIVAAAAAAAPAAPALVPAGPPVTVWAAVDTLHKCKFIDVPDIPARAWISAGVRRMIVGSTSYHHMSGPSLVNQVRECAAAWNMTGDADPSHFAGNEFLDSPVALGNGTVFALVHTEFPGNDYHNCTGPAYPLCWTVTIGLAVSHDDGATWAHARPPPAHLVAAVPYGYNTSQLAYGWGDPSNIVRNPRDGFFYAAIWNRNVVGLQMPGVCIMRTADVSDPASWRAWGGAAYDRAFASPYTLAPGTEAAHVCAVTNLPNCPVGGLAWSTVLGKWVGTFDCSLQAGAKFYWATSDDLLTWSEPESLYSRADLPPDAARNVTSMSYPTFMDDAAGGDNYDTIGATPSLFWVSIGHSPYTDGRRFSYVITHNSAHADLETSSALAVPALLASALGAAAAASVRLVAGGAVSWPPHSIVNDGVMGGRSASEARVTPSGEFSYFGTVSTENNGGFASMRLALPPGAAGARFVVALRGDGGAYMLRVRPRGAGDASFAYEARAPLATRRGEVTVHVAEAADFVARWRGRDVPGAPPLRIADAGEVGLMVTKAQRVGDFAVDVLCVGVSG